MSTFLLELRSEEIPARMQANARAELEKLFRAAMTAAGVTLGGLTVWSTPRRLALIARDLPQATEAVSEEFKGPRTSAPDQALEGFLRKTGLTKDQLTERDGVYFAVIAKPGRATADVLAEAIPQIIRSFSWPKSQRWGAASLSPESLRWVRPLQGIVALLGGEVVPCEIDTIHSGRETMGHRFHSSGPISIIDAESYSAQLREAYVLVDHVERQDLIREKAAQAAAAADLVLVEDEGLVIENAGLTEWPQPLLGRFEEDFLEVPPETIQLTARINQKYFVCEQNGKLANAFICTANIAASDGGEGIVAGNRKVLAARLSDARFFWQQDRKKTLSDHAKGLARITFHEKLGTVADKVERVAKLARWLAEAGIVPATPAQSPSVTPDLIRGPASATALTQAQLADLAEQAARLCKADLTTEMVGEFPELQGLMGGYYARAEGLPDAVADAIRDHYKPVGQGDDVPTAPVTVCVALADKLDTLFHFFYIDQKPTGSKDPFALRRAGLGIIAISLTNNIRWSIWMVGLANLFGTLWKEKYDRLREPLIELLEVMTPLVSRDTAKPFLHGVVEAAKNLPPLGKFDEELFIKVLKVCADVRDFLFDRLEVSVRDSGVNVDLVRASVIVDGDNGKEDDLVRLLARVHALQAFVTTEDGKNLLAGYKRAANILKAEEKKGFTPLPVGEGSGEGYQPEPAEAALIAALATAAPKAQSSVEAEDFTAAMAALATLRPALDAFFEQVTVNASEPATRSARLTLLAHFRAAVHKVADFSKIEG